VAAPARGLPAVARSGSPVGKVEIYFGDERAVPPGDLQSNYRMARESLLDAVPIPPPGASRRPSGLIVRPPPMNMRGGCRNTDLVILGLGEDGHTASLFPVPPRLKSVSVGACRRGPKAPVHRLTVTPPVTRRRAENHSGHWSGQGGRRCASEGRISLSMPGATGATGPGSWTAPLTVCVTPPVTPSRFRVSADVNVT
jgi:hypothetical protein